MRVISGNQKGLPLKAVPGQSTRPTTDKVKESIFNMVGPYFEGGLMLDLYGGSGSIAIEALSRGMDQAIIVDRDKKAIETIYSNLKFCKLLERAEVFRAESSRALKALQKNDRKLDFIFLDPPYKKHRLQEEITFIDEYHLLTDTGVIVVESDALVNLEDTYGNLKMIKFEQYGDTKISIFEKDGRG
ncbi:MULTISPECIES: 16S rRNA (guanine(966)-N(2))-methyltransferase RsmD [Bacillaceae]|uniref:16S rRNA (Guanine(966)-N(2))-methyltransferase RsmD n=1 Tax=Evansella alkalicola TaxID=745819 RepID=A0ABS6JQS6_9BACI|nr:MULTISPECIES: 16S rRNA (guanine(966)-N(2))-methyltransferase RsmD [Bacillaceae]MBU9720466.1 16S rRNA (guanine(966)-N(2))-methyltransferase RsmD [Bacillus alkalicola]